MKPRFFLINFLALLLSLPSFLDCHQSAIAQDSKKVIDAKKAAEIKAANDKRVLLEAQSKASDDANNRARNFFIDYPYETSRLIFFCRRTASLEGTAWINAKGKYANEFVVQEYFRTDKPLPDPMLYSSPPVNVNRQINVLSRLSNEIIALPSLDDKKAKEINATVQLVIDELKEASLNHSWSSPVILAQIEELSRINLNNLNKKNSEMISKKISEVANKLLKLHHVTNINGVGVRVIAEVNSLSGNINVNSLVSLVAGGSQVNGNISTEIFGLGGRQISNAVNISTQLNLETALHAQESILKIREALIVQSGLNFNSIDLTVHPVPIYPIRLDKKLCFN